MRRQSLCCTLVVDATFVKRFTILPELAQNCLKFLYYSKQTFCYDRLVNKSKGNHANIKRLVIYVTGFFIWDG